MGFNGTHAAFACSKPWYACLKRSTVDISNEADASVEAEPIAQQVENDKPSWGQASRRSAAGGLRVGQVVLATSLLSQPIRRARIRVCVLAVRCQAFESMCSLKPLVLGLAPEYFWPAIFPYVFDHRPKKGLRGLATGRRPC